MSGGVVGKTAARKRVKAVKKTARAPARLSPAEANELFARLQALNPHPTTELEFSTPYELLVAVTLSAQATDVGVNKATVASRSSAWPVSRTGFHGDRVTWFRL